jgi:hypothetical protein
MRRNSYVLIVKEILKEINFNFPVFYCILLFFSFLKLCKNTYKIVLIVNCYFFISNNNNKTKKNLVDMRFLKFYRKELIL